MIGIPRVRAQCPSYSYIRGLSPAVYTRPLAYSSSSSITRYEICTIDSPFEPPEPCLPSIVALRHPLRLPEVKLSSHLRGKIKPPASYGLAGAFSARRHNLVVRALLDLKLEDHTEDDGKAMSCTLLACFNGHVTIFLILLFSKLFCIVVW